MCGIFPWISTSTCRGNLTLKKGRRTPPPPLFPSSLNFHLVYRLWNDFSRLHAATCPGFVTFQLFVKTIFRARPTRILVFDTPIMIHARLPPPSRSRNSALRAEVPTILTISNPMIPRYVKNSTRSVLFKREKFQIQIVVRYVSIFGPAFLLSPRFVAKTKRRTRRRKD